MLRITQEPFMKSKDQRMRCHEREKDLQFCEKILPTLNTTYMRGFDNNNVKGQLIEVTNSTCLSA